MRRRSKSYKPSQMYGNEEIGPYSKYNRAFKGLGIAELIIGIICTAVGIPLLILGLQCSRCSEFEQIGTGIWCGVVLIISGSLSVAKTSNSPKELIKANLAFAIIASLCMLVLFMLSFIPVLMRPADIMTYLNFSLCGASLLALIICIVHSAYCCATYCCMQPSLAVVYQNPHTGHAEVHFENIRNLQGRYLLANSQSRDPSPMRSPTYQQMLPGRPNIYDPPPIDYNQRPGKTQDPWKKLYPDLRKVYSGVLDQILDNGGQRGRRRGNRGQENNPTPPSSGQQYADLVIPNAKPKQLNVAHISPNVELPDLNINQNFVHPNPSAPSIYNGWDFSENRNYNQ